MKKMRTYGTGILIGLLNGLFGAGGGIVAVTAFEKMGMPDKSSHATAVAVMIFLSAVSGFLYWYNAVSYTHLISLFVRLCRDSGLFVSGSDCRCCIR